MSGGGGGGGAGGVSPTFDLTEVDLKYNKWVKKLVDFFKPLVESWQKYGPDLMKKVKDTAKSVSDAIADTWKSFEKTITNGTVYKILGNILDIIKNIADAWKKAWTNNNNGDKIIQNLADAFNNLLDAIKKVTESKKFQDWLSNAMDKIRQISEKLASINWQPMIDYLAKLGGKIGDAALWTLEKIVDLFKWIVEHPKVMDIILTVVGALLTLKTISDVGDTISNIIKLFEKTKFPLKAAAVLTLSIISIKFGIEAISDFNNGNLKGGMLKGLAAALGAGIAATVAGISLSASALLTLSIGGVLFAYGMQKYGENTLPGFLAQKYLPEDLSRTINIMLGINKVIWQGLEKLLPEETMKTLWKDMMKRVIETVAKFVSNIPIIGKSMSTAIMNGLNASEKDVSNTVQYTTKQALEKANPWIQKDSEQLGRNTLTAYKTGFESQEKTLTTATHRTLNAGLTANENSLKQTSDKLGKNLNSSVRTGFSGQQQSLNRDFKSVMNSAITSPEKDLKRTSNTMGGNLGGEAKKGFENKFNLSGIKIKMQRLSWSTQPASGWTAKILSALNLPTSLPKLNVSWYAEGGFPTTGDLFIANEAGPELIGRMGNQTAVANSDQIKEGIREAAYMAMTQALSENNEGHKTEVYIGNEKVYEGYSRYQNYQNNKYGASTVRI